MESKGREVRVRRFLTDDSGTSVCNRFSSVFGDWVGRLLMRGCKPRHPSGLVVINGGDSASLFSC
ncbi:hypothetical protein [Gaoshiqia sp. Z1-71]|uniref:hypothetical protein n=1 Tax=Gaoshiqia hydrogeniformans TaxID=3290090 RepID=UPI003BF8C964